MNSSSRAWIKLLDYIAAGHDYGSTAPLALLLKNARDFGSPNVQPRLCTYHLHSRSGITAFHIHFLPPDAKSSMMLACYLACNAL